jgi:hypothetical protein
MSFFFFHFLIKTNQKAKKTHKKGKLVDKLIKDADVRFG